MLSKILTVAFLTVVLAFAPGVALANPEEITASECRDSGEEFRAEWHAACAESINLDD